MRKIILTLFSCIVLAITVAAQDYKNGKTYSITVTSNAGLGAFIDGGVGGYLYGADLKGEYFIAEGYGVSLRTGYLRLKNADTDYPEDFNLVPILAGLNRHFTDWFYATTELGITSMSKGLGTSFTYGVSFGFLMNNKIDASLNAHIATKSGDKFATALLRLGYRF